MKRFILLVTAGCLLMPAPAASQDLETRVAELVKGSAATYSVIRPGVWSVPFNGKSGSFDVRIVVVKDVVAVIALLGSREEFRESPGFYARLLAFNNDHDFVKVVLSDQQLALRMDVRGRAIDNIELAFALLQVSGATEEAVARFRLDRK